MTPRVIHQSSGDESSKVVGDPDGVGHDREGGVDRGARHEAAGIDHVAVVDLVKPAINVQRAGRRIVPKPDRSVLVGNSVEPECSSEVGRAIETLIVVTPKAVEHALPPLNETGMSREV